MMTADVDVMVEMPKPKVTERSARDLNGWPVLGLSLVLVIAAVVLFIVGISGENLALIIVSSVLFVAGVILAAGLTPVSPGRARVLQILGRYAGTIRTDGLRWVNPISVRQPVSTRIRNHETAVAKVNDADGNPIEIAAVVVWQVEDTAQALFEVDDFVEFVAIQTETAVRHIANSYPYDVHTEEGGLSLRDSTDEITETLSTEIGVRVQAAGVHVIESRITHLAYAPEIAQAMLRRQQAGAIVAARARIVEGAVGMVELALDRLSENNVVDLDEERKATMVSNLLVVLCGDRDAQPVVNTGSLYQ
ncbi:SPFH domain-containing protein [Kribbella italica]|uniref:Regulator of protease activity HflC (Stomatin/prohibitin superfamily) n=1 Tax=Kribbella italica TaxID=1540520 RepID=A0A7W9J9M2_9ACTN|nr:SPFH domain-containing protein [Kribbella italica]MBB5837879.1 regulator of protease activity HflC (stomatin/prohibitin superfamily) [Kribbella italica]